MNVAEQAANNKKSGAELDRLVSVAKDLEEILLEYANSKPVKKVFHNNGSTKVTTDQEEEKTNKFRGFIDKIFEFK